MDTSIKTQKLITKKRDGNKPTLHRLILSLLGIFIIVGIWQWATWHLYSLPDHSIVAFTSITTNAFYVIGALVIFFVTGRLVYEWANSTTSNLVDTAQHISQDVNETKTDNQNINIKEDITRQTVDPKDVPEAKTVD